MPTPELVFIVAAFRHPERLLKTLSSIQAAGGRLAVILAGQAGLEVVKAAREASPLLPSLLGFDTDELSQDVWAAGRAESMRLGSIIVHTMAGDEIDPLYCDRVERCFHDPRVGAVFGDVVRNGIRTYLSAGTTIPPLAAIRFSKENEVTWDALKQNHYVVHVPEIMGRVN